MPRITFHTIKGSLANQFKIYFPNWVYVRNEKSFWFAPEETGIWERDYSENALIRTIKFYFMQKLYDDFDTDTNQRNANIRDILSVRNQMEKVFKWLENPRNIKVLIEELKRRIYVADLSCFNVNRNFLLFKNDIVINLETIERINIDYTHMIANNLKLNISYECANNDKIKKVAEFFDKFIPNDQSKQDFINFISNSLNGYKSRQLMINHGGTSKTYFMHIFLMILGTYGMKLSNKWLYNECAPRLSKDAGQKRIILFENIISKKIDIFCIKELLSSYFPDARRIWQDNDDTRSLNSASMFVNVDKIPDKFSESDAVMQSRLIETEFTDFDLANFSIKNFTQQYGMQILHYLFITRNN